MGILATVPPDATKRGPPKPGQSGYLRGTRFMYTPGAMATTSPKIDLAALIADTEGEIVRLVRDRDPSTHGLYEMVRYHLALDGAGANGGKRIRPLLGLLAYASITGDHRKALPGAAAVELGHNFSLVHDDIEDGDRERLWTCRSRDKNGDQASEALSCGTGRSLHHPASDAGVVHDCGAFLQAAGVDLIRVKPAGALGRNRLPIESRRHFLFSVNGVVRP
jgi:hypothetical protein